jgi:hypothetical protein
MPEFGEMRVAPSTSVPDLLFSWRGTAATSVHGRHEHPHAQRVAVECASLPGQAASVVARDGFWAAARDEWSEDQGSPVPSLWGPVAFVSAETGLRVSALITARIGTRRLGDEPEDLGRAMRDASMEITILLSPALRRQAAAASA